MATAVVICNGQAVLAFGQNFAGASFSTSWKVLEKALREGEREMI